MRDQIFREPLSRMAGFEFNRDVAEVFDDMVQRSIPFYAEVQNMITGFIKHFYIRDTSIYDLGCSTGLMMAHLLQQLEGVNRMIGVDNSKPMLDKARHLLRNYQGQTQIELLEGDLREVPIENASAVIMNYTLQFIRPLYRPNLLRRIYQGLKPGGVLLLSEKVLEDSAAVTQLFIDMYYDFKRAQGYTDMEISRKREHLENVLVPYKLSEYGELLSEAGFSQVETFFKWNNFASLIAIRDPD